MFGLVFIPLLALLIIYTICRFCFWLFNPALYASIPNSDITQAFILGVSYDAAILLLLHAPLVLLALFIVNPGRTLRRVLNVAVVTYILLIDVPLMFAAFVDVAYFPFTGRRSTFATLSLGGEMQQQAVQLSIQYWYLWLIGLATLLFLLTSLRIAVFAADFRRHYGVAKRIAVFVLLLASIVIAARGGIFEKPLAIAHAFALGDSRVASLALNTPFVAVHTARRPALERYTYFTDWSEVLARVGEPRIRFMPKPHKNFNVVILVLESFGSEYSSLFNDYPGYMPFFDSLAREGLYFRNSYANGRRSIDAMPAILAGLPEMMEEAYVRSPYAGNELHALPAVLKENGYHTAFFHGGRNGTMFFDVFARMAGISEYYGLDEYPDPRDSDGDWGIFDEPFLQFAGSKLSRFSEPFFAQIFTLSSHNPYPIPAKYKDKFPKGTLPIHESIGYADHALAQFFAFAKTQAWYERTLFVLTGDHTSTSDKPAYQTEQSVYRVPIVFYASGIKFDKNLTHKTVQHADIPMSVFDFVGVHPQRATLFGRSVFDADFTGRVINRMGESYFLIEGGSTSQFSGRGKVESADSTYGQLQRRQFAWLQYFNNGMLDNKLYIDVPK